MKKIRLSEVQCPVCLEILIRPVTLPCNHEFCFKCFEDSINETSLLCPLCRQRISNWAWIQQKTGSLVNEERWQEIQEAFPRLIEKKKLDPEDHSSDDDDENLVGFVNIAEPGEIRKNTKSRQEKARREQRKRGVNNLTTV